MAPLPTLSSKREIPWLAVAGPPLLELFQISNPSPPIAVQPLTVYCGPQLAVLAPPLFVSKLPLVTRLVPLGFAKARSLGASLAPWIVTVIWVVLVRPAVSRIVYVKTSVNVLAEVRRACTDGVTVVDGVGVRPIGSNADRTERPSNCRTHRAVAEACTPAATPLTVFVSPASTSVSLVRTLPVGFVPAVPFDNPPASTAVAESATAIGVSLTAVIDILRVATVLVREPSSTVKLRFVKRSAIRWCSHK